MSFRKEDKTDGYWEYQQYRRIEAVGWYLLIVSEQIKHEA